MSVKVKKVFVGLSGGVDSSVSALRLKKQGYDVVGVFIKVWHPDFMVCNWEKERLDAMRVSAHLEIPFLTCDAEAEYRDEVAKYFIDEYKAGRTPNPDVMCNQKVKFGAFLRFAKERGADFIATGHYARKIKNEGDYELHRGVDNNKDQSYFLWSLSKEQLAYSLFPVGDTPKEKIRAEAELAGIPVARKKDSQGICFLGHIDIPEFLSHYIDLTPGDVLDEERRVIGRHKGAVVYTLGQRHGFTLDSKDEERKAVFVTGRDIEANTITVGKKREVVAEINEVTLDDMTLRSRISGGDVIEAQFRYRQKPFEIKIISQDNRSMVIEPCESVEKPASGQSCVLYKGSLCMGGGIVA